ncbi:peptidase associated/transthyretin-like domain-containing protein [Hymenobacter actinosclerus]|uniref:CarboxypepD_reg-like domain-containing protein n=1 Tax=Hymenobacter actinosclerus TaxID=82805 RepID=A0A1H9YQ71_9BACT|nr:hypothetical protein [Hymenobacter actinosclerus]SES71293.1 hypothetical protein SAMN04487998_0048 [Hymenobacter actinosclerus]
MAVFVPKPCVRPWATMAPTAAGRFCGQCEREVVDFSAMSEAQVRAWLAQPGAGRVCGLFRAGHAASAPVPRWRRWLLTGLALLSLKPLLSSCQSAPPESAATSRAAPIPAGSATVQASAANATAAPAAQDTVVVRGQVLDGAGSRVVAGAELFIGDTPYGTVTDGQGNFRLTLRRQWDPVRDGQLRLRIQGDVFAFEPFELQVPLTPAPPPLTLRLQSVADRGYIMGEPVFSDPPIPPPLQPPL